MRRFSVAGWNQAQPIATATAKKRPTEVGRVDHEFCLDRLVVKVDVILLTFNHHCHGWTSIYELVQIGTVDLNDRAIVISAA